MGMNRMDMKGQGAIEYLLILGTVILVVYSTIYLVQGASTGLGENIASEISLTENDVTNLLRGP